MIEGVRMDTDPVMTGIENKGIKPNAVAETHLLEKPLMVSFMI